MVSKGSILSTWLLLVERLHVHTKASYRRMVPDCKAVRAGTMGATHRTDHERTRVVEVSGQARSTRKGQLPETQHQRASWLARIHGTGMGQGRRLDTDRADTHRKPQKAQYMGSQALSEAISRVPGTSIAELEVAGRSAELTQASGQGHLPGEGHHNLVAPRAQSRPGRLLRRSRRIPPGRNTGLFPPFRG